MSRPLEARAVARMTNVFGVAGSRGRTVGSWLDLARSMGIAATARRLRRGGGGVLGPGVRHAGYPQIWRGAAEQVGARLRGPGARFPRGGPGGPAPEGWGEGVPP